MSRALFLSLIFAAHGAALAAVPCPARPVKVAFYETGSLYFDGDKGVDRDIVDELARRIGCRIEAMAPPRARAYAMLQAGQVDVVTAALPYHERDAYAYFIPYMQQRFATVMLRDVPLAQSTPQGFAADPTLRFGRVRGVNYGGQRDQWLARMEAGHRLEQGASPTTAFRMLGSRRFAAMFAIPLQYEKELADLGLTDKVRIADWFPEDKPPLRCLALSRANFTEAQRAAWTAAAQSMQIDGSIKRILAKYLSPEEAEKAQILK